MRNSTRFGICGFVACMCSFCLSTATGLPQEAIGSAPADATIGEESPLSTAGLPSLRQLEEQNVAVLNALEHLTADRDAALYRYTQTITAQLNALKDAVALQREQESQTARTSNRIILTVAAVSAGLAILMMIFSVFLPIWTLKRFAAMRTMPRVANLFAPAQSNLARGLGSTPFDFSPGGLAISPLNGAIIHLEQRLLALEKRASQSQASARNEASRSKSPAAPISPAPRKPESSTPKSSKSPQVAIMLGAGEAIGFLPRETGLTRFDSLSAFLGKFKKIFGRS